ncbi:MAG: hypothetical protein C5B52_11850 [Bacteroidetes bacterium]|nr:MAG: hypothetical protein C5B52_11850 [Bacteroidota bacterium]
MKNAIALFCLVACLHVNAQSSKTVTSLGGSKGGNISKDALSQIVDSALTVKDASGKSYPVVKFRVFYKFKSTSEDHDTGERKTVDDMRENTFNNTPMMSDNWKESIKDNVAKDDEMVIDNVMVKLPNGKKLLVGGIKFKVVE